MVLDHFYYKHQYYDQHHHYHRHLDKQQGEVHTAQKADPGFAADFLARRSQQRDHLQRHPGRACSTWSILTEML